MRPHPQRAPMRGRQRLGQRQRGHHQQRAGQHDQHGEDPVPGRRAAAPPRPATGRRRVRRREPASAATSPSRPRCRRTGHRRRRPPPPSRRRRPCPAARGPRPARSGLGASRHSSEATMCSTMPAISGRRRPSESDSGPTISCPKRQPGERAGQRQLRHRRGHPELVGDPRQRGQVHVDGQRTQRHQGAEHDDHPGPARARPPRAAGVVSGVAVTARRCCHAHPQHRYGDYLFLLRLSEPR